MILASRPIRFFLMTLGSWIGIRAAMLWPEAIFPPLGRVLAPPAQAEETPGVPVAAVTLRRSGGVTEAPVSPPAAPTRYAPPRETERSSSVASTVLALKLRIPMVAALERRPFQPGIAAPPVFREATRWSASAWAILRPIGAATPFTSQLGGSQAGARVAFAIDRSRRIAMYARVSSAIDTVQREGAIGVDWKPTRLPIHLIAEHRIGIEGTRGGAAVGMVGGFGPTDIAAGVRAEAYGQAGVIFRDGREAFADGALRVTKPVAARIDLGIGAWGGEQRGAARLDVGPTLGATLPVDVHAIRLSLDWRQRIAGNARPGSGPAVSMAMGF